MLKTTRDDMTTFPRRLPVTVEELLRSPNESVAVPAGRPAQPGM
jgi:hypothetical protein